MDLTNDDGDNRFFSVERDVIADEAGGDLVNDPPAKLLRFVRWLYGDEFEELEQLGLRYSQSIIARSESELLGMSSPRFAFRATFGSRGFVNIRRRRKMYDAIKASPDKNLVLHLLASGDPDRQSEANWIADCLLTKPDRLSDYEVLTCSFAEDYGEPALGEVTPFVTHVDFGGGLCAQAACFIALGLAHCERIYGIAEITSQATLNRHSEIKGAFRVRGLSPPQIEQFLKDQSDFGVSAQRQGAEIGKPNDTQRVAAAMRCYLANKMPVIPLVSLSRMLGRTEPDEPQCDGFIDCGAEDVKEHDYGYLPVGHAADPQTDINLCHSVVLVGYGNDGFVIHDPASFPYLTCSDEQLLNIRPRKPIIHRAGEGENQREVKRYFFQAISVTPADVCLSLLRRNYASQGGVDGLFSRIELELTGFGELDFYCPSQGDPGWSRGRIHLMQWDAQASAFRSKRDPEFKLPERIDARLKDLRSRVFWMHEVDLFDPKQGNVVPTLWFWDATASNADFSPLVYAMTNGQMHERTNSE